jgi:hypothetical protein
LIPSGDDIKRQVIPRWRTVRATAAAGELASVSVHAPTEIESSITRRLSNEFELRLKEWRQELDAGAAEELLAAAIVVGATDGEEIRAAAHLIANDQRSLSGSKEIASSILGVSDLNSHEPLSDETAKMHLEIARRKRLLRIYPRDALLLTETALQYTNLGLNGPAARLLRAAAAVAPNSRYVLRSLTRFWVHSGEPDRALHFLSRSGAPARDPWLMAAQMAAEDVARIAPSSWREARRILGAGRFSDFELAELAAATGTLQLEAGSHKLARKMFRRSLAEPTENAVAQAQWASRRDPAIDTSHAVTANAFEALTWEKLFSGEWDETIKAAHDWQGLEPFSVRPAVMGSFVAVAHLGEGASAEIFCRRGLIANKGNSVLHNNLAVALAMQGRVDDASAELANVRLPENIPERVINFATQGLIQMRRGNISEGSDLYEKSMALAVEARNRLLWCRAAAHFAFEYARYDKTDLNEFVKLIDTTYSGLDQKTKLLSSDVPALLSRAQKLQSASDILERMETIRNKFLSYPDNLEPQTPAPV